MRPCDHAGDLVRYLTPEWLDAEAATIDMRRATAPRPGRPGDTIWMGAIDGEGRAVSFIQSLYWEFGSGFILPRNETAYRNISGGWTQGIGRIGAVTEEEAATRAQ